VTNSQVTGKRLLLEKRYRACQTMAPVSSIRRILPSIASSDFRVSSTLILSPHLEPRITIPVNFHNKMQRRAPTHDVGLYLSPECPWHSSSQLALHHPRALAVLSAHHHINQHRLSYCDWCELRDQIFLDIVRSSRPSPSPNQFIH
jgi:hypothetical protein